MKILVTGAAGFIGSNLVRALVKEKHHVIALDNNSRGRCDRFNTLSSDESLYLRIISGDVLSREGIYTLLSYSSADCCIHLASVNGTENFYKDPERTLRVSLQGTMNVLDACAEYKVKTFLYASSSEVYQNPPIIPTPETVPLSVPDPLNPRYSYAVGKIAGEMLTLHDRRLERAIVFRPHNIYGPDMGNEHVIPQLAKKVLALKGNESILEIQGNGNAIRAFCYIDDCVSAILTLLEKGQHSEIYNIGSQNETTIGRLACEIGDYYGRPISEFEEIKPPQGSPLRRCPDISKIKKLGWEPSIDFLAGLGMTLDWYKEKFNES